MLLRRSPLDNPTAPTSRGKLFSHLSADRQVRHFTNSNVSRSVLAVLFQPSLKASVGKLGGGLVAKEIKMRSIIISILFSLLIAFIGCRKEVVSLDQYGQLILDNAIFNDISQLQSNDEIRINRENKIRAMAFIKEYVDTARIDSLTYLEFDREGKLVQRTTDEVTSVGCLPQTIRQVFHYDKGKIKRVDNYTFKYVSNSMFEKWMEDDTLKLNKFDYEDYTYSGDTIIVESGYAIWKFVQDKNGNIIKRILKIKNIEQISDADFNYTPYGVAIEIKNSFIDSTLNIVSEQRYRVEINNVNSTYSLGNARIENVYDDKGLLIGINHYLNDELKARTRIEYIHY